MRTDRTNGLMRKVLSIVEKTPAVHTCKTDEVDPTPPESMHTPHMAAEGSLARRSIGKIKNSVQTT